MGIQIFLDNYPGVYYPGQTITGWVECFFTAEENFRAVKIRFNGSAETRWTETETYYDDFYKEERTRDVEYRDREDYYNAEYILAQGGDHFMLPPGKQTYPFSYALPQQLPSSFKGMYGNVQHVIKALIDRQWRLDDEAELILNLVSPLDLNYLPNLREPVELSVDSTPCSCWCQNTGPITCNMSLPATGFIPGQEVNIGAYVENMSNVTAENVRFEIISSLEYIARASRKHEEKYIIGHTESGIGAHGDKSWTTTLKIPSDLPAPNLIPCRIINLKYFLQVKVALPCPHQDLRNSISLMIGTVALSGVNIGLPAPPQSSYDATAPPVEGSLLPNATAPYSASTDGIGLTPYPPGGAPNHSGATPYPAAGVLNSSDVPPYPSGVEFHPSSVPGWSVPKDPADTSALPSYEEAQQFKEKNDRSES